VLAELVRCVCQPGAVEGDRPVFQQNPSSLYYYKVIGPESFKIEREFES
jgi:hypothetical protein